MVKPIRNKMNEGNMNEGNLNLELAPVNLIPPHFNLHQMIQNAQNALMNFNLFQQNQNGQNQNVQNQDDDNLDAPGFGQQLD